MTITIDLNVTFFQDNVNENVEKYKFYNSLFFNNEYIKISFILYLLKNIINVITIILKTILIYNIMLIYIYIIFCKI